MKRGGMANARLTDYNTSKINFILLYVNSSSYYCIISGDAIKVNSAELESLLIACLFLLLYIVCYCCLFVVEIAHETIGKASK